jgi:hypothetical protein
VYLAGYVRDRTEAPRRTVDNSICTTLIHCGDTIMNYSKPLGASLLALVLASSLGCAGAGTQSSAGEYIDDTLITTRVKSALIGDDLVKAAEVNVETFKGVVQLSGFVSSEEAVAQAEHVARGIEGVVSVQNDMTVRPE